MPRRSALLPVVVASILAGTLHASADSTPPSTDPLPAEMPRTDCAQRFIDGPGDGKDPTGTNVPGLDIASAFLRVTDDELQVYVVMNKVQMPDQMPPNESAYKYEVTFKLGDTRFYYGLVEANSKAPWDNSTLKTSTTGYPQAFIGPAHVTPQGDMTSATKFGLYPDSNMVIFRTQRSRVEDILGVKIKDGNKFDTIDVTTTGSVASTPQGGGDKLDAPTAPAVNQYFAGDDPCFVGPPAKMVNLTLPSVAYSDSVVLSSKLLDTNGAPVAGKLVKFTIDDSADGTILSKETGSDGVARVTYTPKVGQGSYNVTAAFRGDVAVGRGVATGKISVVPETTVIGLAVAKPNSTTRYVTATLSDNDKHVLSGAKVDWYVNGKRVATIATDKAGKSVFKKAKPGQTVYAKYAGITNKYKSVTSKPVKV
jgi:hypothetical protein